MQHLPAQETLLTPESFSWVSPHPHCWSKSSKDFSCTQAAAASKTQNQAQPGQAGAKSRSIIFKSKSAYLTEIPKQADLQNKAVLFLHAATSSSRASLGEWREWLWRDYRDAKIISSYLKTLSALQVCYASAYKAGKGLAAHPNQHRSLCPNSELLPTHQGQFRVVSNVSWQLRGWCSEGSKPPPGAFPRSLPCVLQRPFYNCLKCRQKYSWLNFIAHDLFSAPPHSFQHSLVEEEITTHHLSRLFL